MPANIPNKLPTPGGDGPTAQGFRMAFAAINQLIDVVRSLMPSKSLNTLTSHTSIGVTRKSNPATTGTTAEPGIVWMGEWQPIAYAVNDVVIRKTAEDFNDGTVSGTWICVRAAISADVPGEETDEEFPAWELFSQAHFDHLIIRGTDLEDGSVDINAASCAGKRLYVQVLPTCENGVMMHRMFVCSDAY